MQLLLLPLQGVGQELQLAERYSNCLKADGLEFSLSLPTMSYIQCCYTDVRLRRDLLDNITYAPVSHNSIHISVCAFPASSAITNY